LREGRLTVATMVSTEPAPAAPAAGSSLGAAARAADEVKRAWRAGRPADAAAALKARPSLAKFRSVVIDLVYEEFCLKWEAGETPDPALLAARFPAHKSSIARVLEAHQLLVDNPEVLAPATWPAPAEVVEGLEVVAELGRGAFGRAYLAYDPETARSCVLKLSAGGGAEARVIGRLRHPHVTDVYWARAVGGRTGVCMPLVGVTTLEHVRDAAFGPDRAAAPALSDAILAALDPDRVVPGGPPDGRPVVAPGRPYHAGVAAVMARVAGALAHAHRAGVVHADVKPSNVVLGPGGHPYLIDFNLASVAAGPPGRAGGTLPYMAPEVLAALAGPAGLPGPCPPSADVYSFGVTLFEMLTGHLPFVPDKGPAGEVAAKMLGLIRAGTARVRDTRPRVPAGLAAVAEACLAADPKDRPADLDAVRVRLEAFAGDGRPGRGRRVGPVVGAVVASAVVVMGAWEMTGGRPTAGRPAATLTPAEQFDRGVELLRADRLAEAQDAFARARTGPQAARATACLAYAAARRNQAREGLALGHLAVAHGRDTAAVRNNLGYCLLETGRPAEALAQLDSAVGKNYASQPARYNRAMARFAVKLGPDHKLPDGGAADDMDKAFLGPAGGGGGRPPNFTPTPGGCSPPPPGGRPTPSAASPRPPAAGKTRRSSPGTRASGPTWGGIPSTSGYLPRPESLPRTPKRPATTSSSPCRNKSPVPGRRNDFRNSAKVVAGCARPIRLVMSAASRRGYLPPPAAGRLARPHAGTRP
jgi:hypothetical protein